MMQVPNSLQFMTQELKSPQQMKPRSPYQMMQSPTSTQYMNNEGSITTQMLKSPQQLILNYPHQMMQSPTSPHFMDKKGSITAASSQQVLSQVNTPVNGTNPVKIDGPQMQNQNIRVCVANLMTVDETAAWVRTLAYANRWEEAEEYESIFLSNYIKGNFLQTLTLESLKSELGISNYGHRKKLIMAIKRFFPNIDKEKWRNTHTPNPFVQPCVGNKSCSPSDRTFYSPMVSTASPIMSTPYNGPHPEGVTYRSNVTNWECNGIWHGGVGHPATPQNVSYSAGLGYQATPHNGPQFAGVPCSANVGINFHGNAQHHVKMNWPANVSGNMKGMMRKGPHSGTGYQVNVDRNFECCGHQQVCLGQPANVVCNTGDIMENGLQVSGVQFQGNVGKHFEGIGPNNVRMSFPAFVDGNMGEVRNSSDNSCLMKEVTNLQNVNYRTTEKLMTNQKTPSELDNSICRSSGTICEHSQLPCDSNVCESVQNKIDGAMKKKSKRAAPSNPIKYKVLCTTYIRSGKSESANIIGELEKEQIVIVSQIKGRTARIIEIEENGDYNTLGWVNLKTSDGRPLLIKFYAEVDRELENIKN